MYVQVIPIYFDSDEGAVHYFQNHRGELAAVSGNLNIIMQSSLGARPFNDVAAAIDSDRFPSLQADDIPCLWIESSNAAFKIALPPDRQAVAKLIRRLSAVMSQAGTFQEAREAFRDGPSISQAGRSGPTSVAIRPTFISLHGFNTRGEWQRDIQPSCNAAYIDHVPWSYGYVGIRQLLAGSDRNLKIEWFLEKYESFRGQQPAGAQLPSIVAHSYGSYILAMAMRKYQQIKFHRIILCGSIVKRDYDWDAAYSNGQFAVLLNDFGRKDVWPRVAEWVIADAGSSGYRGFEHLAKGAVCQRENQYWGHSSYFKLLNFSDRWLPFLVHGSKPPVPKTFRTGEVNWRFVALFGFLLLSAVVAVCFAIRR